MTSEQKQVEKFQYDFGEKILQFLKCPSVTRLIKMSWQISFITRVKRNIFLQNFIISTLKKWIKYIKELTVKGMLKNVG